MPNLRVGNERAPDMDLINVGGTRVATRSFGQGEPLVLLNRFRGTMDDWDPALVDALAQDRRVTIFDSSGVGETEGEVPTTVELAADFVAEVIRGLGLDATDVLGWSLGGLVAQVLAVKNPSLVRRLVLAATMPPAGSPEVVWSTAWLEKAGTPVPSVEIALSLFYTDSKWSRAAGGASFARMANPPAAYVSPSSMAVQAESMHRFSSNEGGWYTRLKQIAAPTFVANGDQDGLYPPVDSAVLAREIPRSCLAIYPDSGHGFLFQYVDRFTEDVLCFLSDAS